MNFRSPRFTLDLSVAFSSFLFQSGNYNQIYFSKIQFIFYAMPLQIANHFWAFLFPLLVSQFRSQSISRFEQFSSLNHLFNNLFCHNIIWVFWFIAHIFMRFLNCFSSNFGVIDFVDSWARLFEDFSHVQFQGSIIWAFKSNWEAFLSQCPKQYSCLLTSYHVYFSRSKFQISFG